MVFNKQAKTDIHKLSNESSSFTCIYKGNGNDIPVINNALRNTLYVYFQKGKFTNRFTINNRKNKQRIATIKDTTNTDIGENPIFNTKYDIGIINIIAVPTNP